MYVFFGLGPQILVINHSFSYLGGTKSTRGRLGLLHILQDSNNLILQSLEVVGFGGLELDHCLLVLDRVEHEVAKDHHLV